MEELLSFVLDELKRVVNPRSQYNLTDAVEKRAQNSSIFT